MQEAFAELLKNAVRKSKKIRATGRGRSERQGLGLAADSVKYHFVRKEVIGRNI